MKPIHVLIVNDSLLATRIMKKILQSEPVFSPIGWTKDGLEAEDYVRQHVPDVILMDIHMPLQDGVETTRKILATHQIPILVVTSTISRNMTKILQIFQYGGLDVIKLPQIPFFKKIDKLTKEELKQLGATFIQKTKTISQLKINVKIPATPPIQHSITESKTCFSTDSISSPTIHLVAIGASTGGPGALAQILKSFPSGFPASIVIIQHMDADFLSSFIVHLQQFSHLPIRKANHRERISPGYIYLACRDNHHLICSRKKTFFYSQTPPRKHIPSVDVFFSSAAKVYHRQAVGVLLTGMGADGAVGLKHIRDRGGFTLAQDKSSSIIYGMPKAALDMKACNEVLPLSHIGQRIADYIYEKNSTSILIK